MSKKDTTLRGELITADEVPGEQIITGMEHDDQQVRAEKV